METIQETWEWVSVNLLPHWPGILWVIVVTIIAQTLKVRILTVKAASKYKWVFWLRRVFPLILLGLGALVGAFWPGEASPGVIERAHKIMYFTGCSGVSIIGFNVFKQWVKKKYDVDLFSSRNSVFPGSEEVTKRVER